MNPDRTGPGFVQTARVVERHRNAAAFRTLGISTERSPTMGVGCVDTAVHAGLELESVVRGGRHGFDEGDRSGKEGDGLVGKLHLFLC